MIMRLSVAVGVSLLATAMLGGCATAPRSPAGKVSMHAHVDETIDRFKNRDAGIKEFFDQAFGYAVFPTVAKGAVGFGGAYGKGEVFEGGRMVGFCDLSQASVGLALGGQSYSEVIFFQTQAALNRFLKGNFAFAAQASAVALTSGASADASYEGGVAVFTMAKGGLMYEASIGGQKFSYEPASR